MFISKIHKKTKKKSYCSILLRESYRDENGKSQKRTLANLSSWPEEIINNLDLILKGGKVVNFSDSDQFLIGQGKSYGAIKVISKIFKRLGISKALGRSKYAKQIQIMIAGIILSNKKSKNYIASDWSKDQAIEDVFNLEQTLKTKDLYDSLDYLSKNQLRLERKIWNHYSLDKKEQNIFLYDITSSYTEGDNIAFSEYGYNRDKKRGKKQIVIGLMTNTSGIPISIEVFKGNERDYNTVEKQLDKLKNNFNINNVVFVGDRGMIKSKQIEKINNKNWQYITGITKPQLKKLINDDIIQMDLFDTDLVEVEDNGIRYILRRNSVREMEMKESLQSKINVIKNFTQEKNIYLKEHTRAKEDVAVREIIKKIKKLQISKYVKISSNKRIITFEKNQKSINEFNQFAGCYTLKTNIKKEIMGKDAVHSKYKDLYEIETNFRTLKTDFLDIRPIFVRKAEHVKGHVFACMLALMVVRYVKKLFAETKYKNDFIWQTLDKIQTNYIHFENQKIKKIPTIFSKDQSEILRILEIKFPKKL